MLLLIIRFITTIFMSAFSIVCCPWLYDHSVHLRNLAATIINIVMVKVWVNNSSVCFYNYWQILHQKYVFMNEFRHIWQQQNILRFWKGLVNLAIKTKILLVTWDQNFLKWGLYLLFKIPEVLSCGKYSKLLNKTTTYCMF